MRNSSYSDLLVLSSITFEATGNRVKVYPTAVDYPYDDPAWVKQEEHLCYLSSYAVGTVAGAESFLYVSRSKPLFLLLGKYRMKILSKVEHNQEINSGDRVAQAVLFMEILTHEKQEVQ